METKNKKDFLEAGVKTLGEIYDLLEKLSPLKWEELQGDKAALVIVDMVNGFAREGALSSPRVERLIPVIVKLSEKADRLGMAKLAFADSHTGASPEFGAYPEHCLAGTAESEIVQEIKEAGGYRLIAKNSTNGFFEEEFREWLAENPQIDTFLVTGDCTDLCILQFATTLKTWFNRQDRKSRVIVPADAVDTYDLGTHSGDLMHTVALYNMMINGIEVVREME